MGAHNHLTRDVEVDDSIETVEDVPDDYTLITGSFEVQKVLDHCGYVHGECTGVGLLVRTDEGAYTDVLAFEGNVPYLYKSVERIR
jgi:hypothetical protein